MAILNKIFSRPVLVILLLMSVAFSIYCFFLTIDNAITIDYQKMENWHVSMQRDDALKIIKYSIPYLSKKHIETIALKMSEDVRGVKESSDSLIQIGYIVFHLSGDSVISVNGDWD